MLQYKEPPLDPPLEGGGVAKGGTNAPPLVASNVFCKHGYILDAVNRQWHAATNTWQLATHSMANVQSY